MVKEKILGNEDIVKIPKKLILNTNAAFNSEIK